MTKVESIFSLCGSAPTRAPLALARLMAEAKSKAGYARNTIADLFVWAAESDPDDRVNEIFCALTGTDFLDNMKQAEKDPQGYGEAAEVIAVEAAASDLADGSVLALWAAAKRARVDRARAQERAARLPGPEGEQYDSRADHARIDARDPKTWEPVPYRDEDGVERREFHSPHASPVELARVLDPLIPSDTREMFAVLFAPNPRASEEGQTKTVCALSDATYGEIARRMLEDAGGLDAIGSFTGPIARAAFRIVQRTRAERYAKQKERVNALVSYLLNGDKYDGWRLLNAARDGNVLTLTAIACNLNCDEEEAKEVARLARGAYYKALNP